MTHMLSFVLSMILEDISWMPSIMDCGCCSLIFPFHHSLFHTFLVNSHNSSRWLTISSTLPHRVHILGIMIPLFLRLSKVKILFLTTNHKKNPILGISFDFQTTLHNCLSMAILLIPLMATMAYFTLY